MPDAVDYISLSALQRARKYALGISLIGGLVLVAFTRAMALGEDMHDAIEAVGVALLVICILGRVWCSLYIGGRKVRQLVTNGPYSVVRNPLYLFSLIGAAGVGAQAGSLVMVGLCVAAALLIFGFVTEREERALLAVHGQAYADYRARTPRLIPNLSLWWDHDQLTVRPGLVARTFADGLLFLLAIPLAEALEHLQEVGVLHTFLTVP